MDGTPPWTQFIDENLQAYLKGKYPCTSSRIIFTELEQLPGLFSIC